MADIRYRCPNCAEKLCIDEAATGMQILSPQCRCTGIVPRPGPPGVLLSVEMRFRCPSCEKKMSVDISRAGEVIACPGCREPMRIPLLPEKPKPAAPAPASVLTDDEVQFLMAQ